MTEANLTRTEDEGRVARPSVLSFAVLGMVLAAFVIGAGHGGPAAVAFLPPTLRAVAKLLRTMARRDHTGAKKRGPEAPSAGAGG